MSFNQQPQSKQQTNRSNQASPPSAYTIAQRERTYQRWLRPLLGEPPWPISEIDQDFPNRRMWPSDWAGLAHQLCPCHSWAEVVAQIKAWLLAQPERLLHLLAALRPGRALRRLSLPQLVALALSAGLTAGMVGRPLLALAQEPAPEPVGAEFRVNTYTTNFQGGPSVAMDADGDFVIVWRSSSSQDGDSYGIYAQLYNAGGTPQGSEFRVNTYTTGFQSFPSMAMDADGDFVITWESNGPIDTNYGIYAQRYNANGTPQGSEFQVNTHTTDSQIRPSVAMDTDGDFVIAWLSRNQDGDNFGVYAQRYNASGTPQGSEFQVNSYTTGSQSNSHIAMDADGNFIIVWVSEDQDTSDYGIYAQRYSESGVPQSSEFRVNTFTTGFQGSPSIAIDDDGDFIVTWFGSGLDDSEGIYAQRYNASGTPEGTEFLVNTYTSNSQVLPNITVDADGDFVITWQSFFQDGDDFDIYAQRYNFNGTPQNSEFQVNSYTTNRQGRSRIAIDADGDFVITWESLDQDNGNYGVYAQRYGSTRLTLNKKVGHNNPSSNEYLTYTLTVNNSGFLTATNAVISDTLPGGLAFAGSVTLEGSTGTVADEAADLPILASGLTIAPNGRITVTLPVTVTAEEGQITNVAAVTSSEVTTPVTGFVTITVGEQRVYLPLVLKE